VTYTKHGHLVLPTLRDNITALRLFGKGIKRSEKKKLGFVQN